MDEEIMGLDVLERIFEGRTKPTDLKLSALQSITGNFLEERIIGTGGFGTVYKGVLRNGEVAVKKIKNNHTINENVFRREVNSLLNVSHENIVRFLGFCSHTEHKVFKTEGSRDYIYAENRERILCFEYINNGSLEKYIADELRGLHWDIRFLIIKGICEGLQYLHMEKQIIHMDLKPANILIDYNMVAKITDFGLSRMEENAQTKSTNRVLSPGYAAPEYIDKGEMSVKYDVYSLGIIIIELVTGHRSIPDSNNVLRRWRHRLQKSGKETPFRYQQIAKLIEIGLLCQEKDPYKRPFISDIIRVINELENTDRSYKSTRKQSLCDFSLREVTRETNQESRSYIISPYLEDDMLGIEPLELCFPFELNNQISCSLELTNGTNAFIAFSIQTTSPLPYCIQRNQDIVAPRSKYSVNITLQPLENAPQDKHTGNFIVRSTKVNGSLISEDITDGIFNRDEGKLVDEVNLTITYKAEVPQMDVSLESLIISDTRSLHGPQESSVPPTDAESEISPPATDEIIQFDPPALCFPLVPDKNVLSSIKIMNVTEFYVSFVLAYRERKRMYFRKYNGPVILPPRSTHWLMLTTKDAVTNMHLNDELDLEYAIVAEDIKASDLDWDDHTNKKLLPIVLTKITSCTINELIQFDPPELSFPDLSKTSFSSVNIVNITDCNIAFGTWSFNNNVKCHDTEPSQGILPPRSTQRMIVKWVPRGKEPEDSQSKNNKLFVWNMIVAEGVESKNISDFNSDEDIKELPLICKKISPCTSDELIRLDHPEIRFTFSQNKTALSSINMVNITDYYIGFRLSNGDTNTACYQAYPELGILEPRSAQRVVIAREIMEKEPEDMQYNDKFFMWNAIVSEVVKTSDLGSCMSLAEEQSKELPIFLNKASSVTSSTSVEMIKFEPPEVRFPFLPSKHLSSSIRIVNITDYHIGFNTRVEKTNVASYITEPPCGILPPWSTQELVITRVANEEAPELEDMKCQDKYFMWSGFVTEDVNASDLEEWVPITERKELPIVFTETSSHELIQFDPPELCFPMSPNQRVLSSVKIVNITDQYIGFIISTKKSNSARYNTNPPEGILPPLSTQVLMVTRITEEMELEDIQCKDEIFMWNGIVTGDGKAIDVIDNMSEAKCTELSIVLTKSSSISNELIQFDPQELYFPLLPNKKVLSSIKLVNLTDCNVGFNTYSMPTNAAWYHTEPPRGILPPRSTQKLMITREEKEDGLKDKQLNDKYFVWKSIVSECVIDNDLSDYIADQESKELPIILDKLSPCTSKDLIQFDPPELSLPFMPSKPFLFSVNIINNTDYCVGFNGYNLKGNAGRYNIQPGGGVMSPRSSQRLVVLTTPTKKEHEDMQCEDNFFVWSCFVSDGVQASDIFGSESKKSKELPIFFKKTSLCTSDELIKFDPPQLPFPFVPNKRVPMLRLLKGMFKIVNVTDHIVCFHIWCPGGNSTRYKVEPATGILPPQSTQEIKVRRTLKEKETEDMECKDKIFVWNGIVTEGVEVSDVSNDVWRYRNEEVSKELPIVFTKVNSQIC
ncbi:hypothetical protein ACQ4PT_036375 [Festuca glaucescens]